MNNELLKQLKLQLTKNIESINLILNSKLEDNNNEYTTRLLDSLKNEVELNNYLEVIIKEEKYTYKSRVLVSKYPIGENENGELRYREIYRYEK